MSTIPYTPRYKKVLAISHAIAREYGHDYVGTEHMLLAMLREGVPGLIWEHWRVTEEEAAEILRFIARPSAEDLLRAELEAMKKKISDMEDILSNNRIDPPHEE